MPSLVVTFSRLLALLPALLLPLASYTAKNIAAFVSLFLLIIYLLPSRTALQRHRWCVVTTAFGMASENQATEIPGVPYFHRK